MNEGEGNCESMQASTAEDGEGDIFQFLFNQVVVEAVDGAIVTIEVSYTETRVWSSWGMESSSSYCSFFYIEVEG